MVYVLYVFYVFDVSPPKKICSHKTTQPEEKKHAEKSSCSGLSVGDFGTKKWQKWKK
jgi:hypothetical protein